MSTAPRTSTPGTSPTRSSSSRRARLDHLRRLTLRDRQLLAWLAEHYVLSADQIAQALFHLRPLGAAAAGSPALDRRREPVR